MVAPEARAAATVIRAAVPDDNSDEEQNPNRAPRTNGPVFSDVTGCAAALVGLSDLCAMPTIPTVTHFPSGIWSFPPER
jgi:hypothetical protein